MTSEVITEPAGPRFGPYVLTAVLGRGGMGVVYRAFDTVKGDVYSLACVLYECLTGRPPFTGEMVAVMWAQLNAVRPAPSTLRPGLSAAADEVVARGLAKDPAHRYGTAGELAEAILAATADLGAVGVPVPGADQVPDRRNPPAVEDSVPAGDYGPVRPGTDVPLWDSDPDGQARAALRAIVSDPDRGVAALSSTQAMSTALKDLLPDMPRETKVLIAAAEEGLAEALSYHVARGMDPATVRDKVARSFARHTGFRPAACQWAVDELAAVLGLDSAGARPVT